MYKVHNSLLLNSDVLVAPKEIQPLVEVVLREPSSPLRQDVYYYTPRIIIYPRNSRVLTTNINPNHVSVGINPVDNIINKNKLTTYYSSHDYDMEFVNSSYFFVLRDQIPLDVTTYQLGVNIFNSKDYSHINTLIYQSDERYAVTTPMNVTSIIDTNLNLNFRNVEVGTKGKFLFNRFSTIIKFNFFTIDNPLEPCALMANYKIPQSTDEGSVTYEQLVMIDYHITSDETAVVTVTPFATNQSFVKYYYSETIVELKDTSIDEKLDEILENLKIQELYEKGTKWLEYNTLELGISLIIDTVYKRTYDRSIDSVYKNINESSDTLSLSRDMSIESFVESLKAYIKRIVTSSDVFRESFNETITNTFESRVDTYAFKLAIIDIATLDVPEEDEEENA